ncbi:MAG: ATP-binding cassette domain-containing protein [Gemmatimonadaceae bacterium]|nr:ATP-binding cassette domain-containing protein [Gemmatimonadaceae bacterium]
MVVSSGTDRPVTAAAPRLALGSIRRSYGSVLALDDASLSVAAGEVHALLGENGAGKSTMMKIAFGLDRADVGTIHIDGRPTTMRSPRDAMAHGIGMVQQHFALVDAMTVAENVALGGIGAFSLEATAATIRRIGVESGLDLDPGAIVRDLPIGAQQRLEIVKALARRTTTLILDEPTAVLSPTESTELLEWIRRFADSGGTVILIAHKLREVLSVADRVTVLRRGRTVLSALASDVTEDSLAGAMLGDSAARAKVSAPAPAAASNGPVVLSVTGVSVADATGIERLRDATLEVRAGEIVGVAAIEGAGQRELLRVLAGRMAPTRGTVHLPASIGFAPEDRHRDAVVLDATLTENVALRGAGQRRGIIGWDALRSTTTAMMKARDVRADSEAVTIRTLSGGNQQKLVLGRELADAPPALVVENPTRGLDIRATADVQAALRAARDAGMAVVVYSSDLDEVLSLADRVVVVAAGRIRDVPSDRESVGRAMLSGVS